MSCSQIRKAVDGCTKADVETEPPGTPATPAHVVRQQLWSKVDVTRGATSAWRESEFATWLEQKLEADRRELAERLREQVSQHLAAHQEAVIGQMGTSLRAAFEASTPGAGRGGPDRAQQAQQVETPGQRVVADSPAAPAAGAASRWPGSPREWPCGPVAQIQPKMGKRDSDDVPEVSAISTKDTSSSSKRQPKDDDMESKCTGDGDSKKITKKSSLIKALDRRRGADEDQRSCHRYLTIKGLVSSNAFEVVCSFLIVLNTLMMAAEVQFVGCDVGYAINHPDCPPSTKGIGSDSSRAFLLLTLIFGVLFLIELLLRVAAMRTSAIFSAWIWFDAFLIILGFLDTIQRMGGSVNINVNLTMMRTARIARILRIIRFLKPHEGFGSLFLIIRSIHASRHALLWSILILLIMMSCVGMMINQMVYQSFEDAAISEEDRRALFDYWGTFTRTMITMFEVTLGNWAPPSRLLMTRVSQWWGLFVVVYRCIFCYSVINVIAAVFITETNRAAAADDEMAMMKKERDQKANVQKLKEVFLELDESGDGVVTWEEFHDAVSDPVMRRYLSTMELEVNDLDGLFKLLDDGDGQVEASEFVEGITTLRGQAKNIDMLTLLKVSRKMNGMLERLESGLLHDNQSTHNARSTRRGSAGAGIGRGSIGDGTA